MTASVLYPAQCILGEGPIWHGERNSCFWADIEGMMLYEYNTETKRMESWKFKHRISLAVPYDEINLLIAFQGGLAKFDLNTGAFTELLDIDKEIRDNRCNDGACDSEGRLWIGTMNTYLTQGAGSLYCVDKNFVLKKKLEHVSISNGLTWSPDNKTLYYIDSPSQMVQAFSFDAESGDITFQRKAIGIPSEMGTPDGMAIDEEGMLWIAHWGGFGVYRWNPLNGKLINKIEVPAPQVSSCAFCGKDMDELIITTARENMTMEEWKKYPHSGDVFIAKPGVKGIAANKCRL